MQGQARCSKHLTGYRKNGWEGGQDDYWESGQTVDTLAVGVMAGVKEGGPAGVSVGRAAGSEGGLQRGVEGCHGPCHLAAGTLECHGAGLMVRVGWHRTSWSRRGTPSLMS